MKTAKTAYHLVQKGAQFQTMT